jgi:CRP/FNR family cyclic AMP-dependent transcriptional regulator
MPEQNPGSSHPLIGLRLPQNPLFAQLSEDDLRRLSSSMAVRSVRAGEIICSEGSSDDHAYLILSGKLEISRVDTEGHKLLFRILSPPAMVGLSVVAGKPHTADVIAFESGSLGVLKGELLRKLLRDDPGVALQALAAMGALVQNLSDEIEELRHLPLKNRVWKSVSRNRDPDSLVHITHENLGLLVGATRARVSKALAELERDGVIETRRGGIIVLKPYPMVP